MNKNDIFESMEKDVINSNISEEQKSSLLKNIMKLREQQINIMITGATGCGKSSTINALFQTEIAKVGTGAGPETMEISRYELDNLILWDSPGLGDGVEADRCHARNIIRKLAEKDTHGNALIDLVLVILDGSTKDLGTSYELINQVIIPNLGEEKEKRILVAVNQADAAMKGRYWDYENNEPMEPLRRYLEEKVASVRERIREGTGVDVEPIYYSAGYKEEGLPQTKPYNLSKLLYYMVCATPKEKRMIYVDHTNEDPEMWKHDDRLSDYVEETRKSLWESIVETAGRWGSAWGDAGSVLGETGRKVFSGLGKLAGGLAEVGKAILPHVFLPRRRGPFGPMSWF